jgi:hypothetical protein
MPAKKPMAEWKHGTHGTYVNGCRCDLCRKAAAAYKRDLYHRTLERSRTYFRERYHRRKKTAVTLVGSLDETLIRRDREYRQVVASATGELAALVAEQSADDVHWIRPDLRLYARPFDESHWGGWGEPDPRWEQA